jgi:hypothetical protein
VPVLWATYCPRPSLDLTGPKGERLYQDRQRGGFSERPEGMLPVMRFYVSASMFPPTAHS